MSYPGVPTMRLYITSKHFILQCPDTGISAQLLMERNTGRCVCTSGFNPLDQGITKDDIQYIEIFSILGIIPIGSVLFVGVITEADVIGTINGFNVYEVKGIEMIEFESKNWETEDITYQKQSIMKLLTTGFFFSYYYDLTNSIQNSTEEGTLHDRAEKRYYWNLELYKDLLLQGIHTQWLIPIIQGYVGIRNVNQGINTFIMTLISRRSCERTGTRYNCRGVDDDGNVANFVETEQILQINDALFSYVQIRGSVPLFWEQTGVTAQLALTRSSEMSMHAFRKHVDNMVDTYKHVMMVNLLCQTKSHEWLLINEWENIFNRIYPEYTQKIGYQYFDFHSNCRGQRYNKLNLLVDSLSDFINYHLYYCKIGDKVEVRQKGVMRSNCLDCLDRTNVVQSFIAWELIRIQLRVAGYDFNLRLDDSSNNFVKSFKHLWADNGDMLSMQYTGTGSTISSVTREGKQGIKGLISSGIKSIGRFYNANVQDAMRQQSIDAVLRRRGTQGLMNKVEQEIFFRENEYCQFQKLRFRCITWNLAGRKLPTNTNLLKLFSDGNYPDVIVIAFQEIVKLNARNVVQESSNQATIASLKELIDNNLEHVGQAYSFVRCDDLVGIALYIYALESVKDAIKHVDSDTVKVGFKGKMGNKGAVLVRFNIYDTSFCFLGCHLASGSDQNEARKSQLIDIHARGFQKDKAGKPKLYTVSGHDIRIICGDLNFRIALGNYQVRSLVQIGNFDELFQAEQLTHALRYGELSSYKESPISFKPTYKFDIGTDIYDTSKKQRSPAWCDRILFSGENIEPVSYTSIDVKYSDHRPVVHEFLIQVKQVDKLRRKEIADQLYGQIDEKQSIQPDVAAINPVPEIEEVDLLSI